MLVFCAARITLLQALGREEGRSRIVHVQRGDIEHEDGMLPTLHASVHDSWSGTVLLSAIRGRRCGEGGAEQSTRTSANRSLPEAACRV